MFSCFSLSIDITSQDLDELVNLLLRSSRMLDGYPESDDLRYFAELLKSNSYRR